MTTKIKRNIMKEAHKLAKKMVGDYQARLALALRKVWQKVKNNKEEKEMKLTKKEARKLDMDITFFADTAINDYEDEDAEVDFGKYQGEMVSEIPTDYLIYIAQNNGGRLAIIATKTIRKRLFELIDRIDVEEFMKKEFLEMAKDSSNGLGNDADVEIYTPELLNAVQNMI